jgi:uncharacterized protein DUF4262
MNEDHDESCECGICKDGVGAYDQWEAEMMEKIGWIQHYVYDDPDLPCGVNHHTHGLSAKFGHPDLQLVGPLSMELGGNILNNIVNRLAEGERYSAGAVLEGILKDGFLVKLVPAKECGRDVLRVILPDPEGKVDREDMAEPWVQQYADLLPTA